MSLKGRYCFIEVRAIEGYENVLNAIKLFPSAYTIIGGWEVGEENPSIESKHLHAFIDCGRNAGLLGLQKMVAGYGDFTIPKYGETGQMRDYCIKLEKKNSKGEIIKVKEPFGNQLMLFESGIFFDKKLGQGARNDLRKILLDNNYDVERIQATEPTTYSKYRNGINDICQTHNKKKICWIGWD